MEALIGIFVVALVLAVIVMPVVILTQLSSIKENIRNLSSENRRILTLLSTRQEPPAAEQRLTDEAGGHRNPAAQSAPAARTAQTAPPQTAHPKPPPLPQSAIAEAAHQPARAEALGRPLPPARGSAEPASRARPAPGPVAETFRRIWRWFLFGDEGKTRHVSKESAIASRMMMFAFVVFVVAAVAYGLKWSIERQFLGPAGRFAVGLGFGISMLISGIKLIKTRYRMIGEGLLGGGIVILYLCIYAADVMYQLMPTPAAFALMAAITFTAGFLSVRLDSMLVAIFGIIGGYLTPLALSVTVLSLPGFYSYILILSIAVLAIALVKQWRLLNYLGFILTYGLFFLHSMEHYDKAADFAVAVTFLTLLFAVQSLTVCVHNIFKREPSSIIEAVHLILNALIYSAGGYFLITEAHGRPWPAIMSLGLALFYMLYILLFLRRGLKDRLLLLCLISLAAAYTAWTLPLVLEKESLTIALALLAFIFLWLGRKVQSNFLQSLSYLVYAVTFFRIAAMDMPGNYSLSAPDSATWSEYFKDALDRLFTFGISIGSIVGAFLLSRHETKESSIIFPENDINAAAPAKTCRSTLFWASVAFVFAFLNLEINTMFRCWDPIRLPMLTLLWGGLTVFLFSLMLGRERAGSDSSILKGVTCAALGIALIKLLFIDTRAWNLTQNFIYDKEYALLDAGMRLFDFGIMLAVILLIWRLITRSKAHASSSTQFGYSALALFFLFCTLELRTLLHWKLAAFLPAGISILWALFAVSFIICGISKNKGSLRATGLVLFAIVCGKVVILDLKDLSIIYRIVALLVIGAALLAGSFAYLKSGPAAAEREES
jgi:uncharacterized membrane protein